jgi:hypothetical protein
MHSEHRRRQKTAAAPEPAGYGTDADEETTNAAGYAFDQGWHTPL